MSTPPEVASTPGAVRVEQLEPFERLLGQLSRRREIAAGGLWGSAQALLLAALVRRRGEPWVVILSSDSEARSFAEDLQAFGATPEWFPAREAFAAASCVVDRVKETVPVWKKEVFADGEAWVESEEAPTL